MSAGNVFRRWAAAIRNGEKLPALASGESYSFVPEVDDDNFYFGDGTLSWDLRIYGSAAANYISWDASANDLKFEDNVSVMFGSGATAGEGTAGDIEIRWDGTDLDVLQTTANSSIKFGVNGAGIDIVLYGDTASAACTWDQSADELVFSGGAILDVPAGQFQLSNVAVNATAAELNMAADNSANTEIVTGTNLIAAAESGSTYILSSGTSFTSTLPAPAIGLRYRFIVGAVAPASGYLITTTGPANIFKGMVTERAGTAGVAGSGVDVLTFVATNSIPGDWVEVYTDGTTWFFHGQVDVAAGFTAA